MIFQLRLWNLDLCKLLAFGSNEANNIMGFQTCVSTGLRKEVNPFLLACHCIVHRINFVALDVAKTPDYKVLSIEIDVLINLILSFF